MTCMMLYIAVGVLWLYCTFIDSVLTFLVNPV